MDRIIRLENGTSVELQGDPKKPVKDGGALLGEGGEGLVYLVKNSQAEELFALKIYRRPISQCRLQNLRATINHRPHNEAFLLWPLCLTEPLGKEELRGYIMPLNNNKEFVPLSRIVMGKETFSSTEVELKALKGLAQAINNLHSKGLQFTDLNIENILVDYREGRILFCDTGNICAFGKNNEVLGHMKYGAPEVLARHCLPDKYSDLFSLAVLLFLVLTHAHPFDGIKRLSGQLTPTLQEKIYVMEPVFIFHPTNKSNRPDPQIDVNALKAWSLLPQYIKKMFIKTFTHGIPVENISKEILLKERQKRTSAKEWVRAFEKWMSEISSDSPIVDEELQHRAIENVNNALKIDSLDLPLKAFDFGTSGKFNIISFFPDDEGSTREKHYLVADENVSLYIIEDCDSEFYIDSLKETDELLVLKKCVSSGTVEIVDTFIRENKIFIVWNDKTEMKCLITERCRWCGKSAVSDDEIF